MPATASQNGGAMMPWSANATGPCQSCSPISLMTSLCSCTRMASPKKSPNSIGPMVMKPMRIDGIASRMSGMVTTAGLSCGSP